MQELVSVIVPVYKVEKYLQKCVDSVINQSYGQLEVILIDDGSPDDSGRICDEFAVKDMRVKTYHIPNGGVSRARNFGLDRASGDYIFFLDSDDYLEPDCLATLMTFLHTENVDCSICAANIITEDLTSKTSNSAKNELQVRILARDNAIAALCYLQKPYSGIDMGAIWGCLFKKDAISSERFDSEISIGEDFEFKFRVLRNVGKVACINAKLYNYRILSNSTMRNGFDLKKYESVVRLSEMAECQQEYEIEFLSRTVNIALVVLLMIPKDKSDDNYRKKIEEYIRSKRHSVLRNVKCRKKLQVALMLSYFGFPLMKAVFRIAKKEPQ